MAFSLRKMLSNISYFTKPEDSSNEIQDRYRTTSNDRQINIFHDDMTNLQRTEADSTSKCPSLNLPDSLRQYASKKGYLSDTDILNITPKEKRKFKKLKLDIHKASQSLSEKFDNSEDSTNNIENTPKHVSLDCKSSDVFSERLKKFNFDQSFDISDTSSDDVLSEDEHLDVESLTDHSESELTEVSSDDVKIVKMCRKVGEELPSVTPESFGDVEIGRNEEERVNLLLNYQMRFEKLESILKKLLSEFKFHIEVSKIFTARSIVNVSGNNIPRNMPEIAYKENVKSVSPSWDIIMENEDLNSRKKLHNQLVAIRNVTNTFLNIYFEHPKLNRSLTFDVHKGKRLRKQPRLSEKKRIKHFDFPDLRDAMLNLFNLETEDLESSFSTIDSLKCCCKCQCQDSAIIKTETDTSITSSIGNFTLDSTTLSAYSETLDVISYNSYHDTSLYSSLLQKSSIERITFYIQVHSIQLHCEPTNDFESKNIIKFHCPSCNIIEDEENGLLQHILSQKHGEKLHFLYKAAYIKKCVAQGKEIMPSTVLNPMTMYRDDNKIVCFGDAVYACTLCFENLIVGESVLMAHCSETEHLSRKEMLENILG